MLSDPKENRVTGPVSAAPRHRQSSLAAAWAPSAAVASPAEISGGNLVYTAVAGETNGVTVTCPERAAPASHRLRGQPRRASTASMRSTTPTPWTASRRRRSSSTRVDTGDTVAIAIAVPATVNGGEGNDTLNGSSVNDTLNGGNGADTLNGLAARMR